MQKCGKCKKEGFWHSKKVIPFYNTGAIIRVNAIFDCAIIGGSTVFLYNDGKITVKDTVEKCKSDQNWWSYGESDRMLMPTVQPK